MYLNFFDKAFIFAAALTLPAAFAFLKFFGKYIRYFAVVLVFAVLGISYFHGYDVKVRKRIASFDKKEITIDGIVQDAEYYQGSLRVTVKGRINGRVKAVMTFFTDDSRIDYYDRAVFSLTAAVPENTVSFASKDYNVSRGIFLTAADSARLIENKGCKNTFMRAVKRRRDKALGRIYSLCSADAGAFAAAMLCSDKSHMTAQVSDSVYRAGLGHIFAVSGTHIAILYTAVSSFLSQLDRKKRISSLAAVTTVWLFALFTGFSPSVTRACLMMSIAGVGDILKRRGDCANSLGAAALAITICCPYLITSVSFVMSFAAAFSAGVISPAISKKAKAPKAAETPIVCICVSVMTLPLCAVFFSEASLIGAAVNILLIPLCTLALLLLFVFLITGAHIGIIAQTAGVICSAVIRLCKTASCLPIAYVGTYHRRTLVLAGVLAVFLILCPIILKDKITFSVSKLVSVYLALWIASVGISKLPYSNELLICPASRGCCGAVFYENTAYIFDISDSAKFSYTLSQEIKRRGIKRTMVFTSGNAMFLKEKYSAELSGSCRYFSTQYDFPERGIRLAYDGMELNNSYFASDKNGIGFEAEEISVRFSDDKIIFNGKEYEVAGFTDRAYMVI